MALPARLRILVEELTKLPSIGSKSAHRMAFALLKGDAENARRLSRAIVRAVEEIDFCPHCFAFRDPGEGQRQDLDNTCLYCCKPRDLGQICVVQEAENIFSFEQIGAYRGTFHVLQGLLSPMRGITPEKIRIGELEKRVKETPVQEIILALNPTIEGEATAHYVSETVKPYVQQITRLAIGVPLGIDIEYSDAHTLAGAFENRRQL